MKKPMIPKNTRREREVWLGQAVDALTPLFASKNYTVPANLRVSVGFPYRAGRKAIGQAFSVECSQDKTFEVFVSPVIADPQVVLATLVHEVCHTVAGLKAGHRGPFRKCAKDMGLVGKMTATSAGEELAVDLHRIASDLGPYPHAELRPVDRKKQTTRLLKIACSDCGMPLRVTRQWLDEYPLPWVCPCGGPLDEEGAE